MAEYKIIQVSSKPPREWTGDYGTTYYHTVRLADHEKPVEIGKKKPDKLEVGSTVTGTILKKPDKSTDGFKAEYTQGSQGTRSAGQKEFKADPIKQDSIEWQACLKAAVETVRDYNALASLNKSDYKVPTLIEYKEEVYNTLVTYKATINAKPDKLIEIDEPQEDLPPVDAYKDDPTFGIDTEDLF